MLTAQGPSIPLKPTSNVVVQVLPPSIMSSSRITREVQDSRTRAVRTSSSICLKTSRKESSSSSEAGRSSRSSAETIIKAGRRRIIRDSPRLSSRQQRTHKRSNVQGKVTSRATTSNSNTPTKESSSLTLTMVEKDKCSNPAPTIPNSSNLLSRS